jgi:hypothetical protein
MNNEKLDTVHLCFLKRRDTGINGKTDLSDLAALAGPHLQAVQGRVFDLSDPQRLVQKTRDVPDRRSLHVTLWMLHSQVVLTRQAGTERSKPKSVSRKGAMAYERKAAT